LKVLLKWLERICSNSGYVQVTGAHLEEFLNNVSFLGALAKFRKETISFVMSVSSSVRPSVHMKQLCSHWTDFHEI